MRVFLRLFLLLFLLTCNIINTQNKAQANIFNERGMIFSLPTGWRMEAKSPDDEDEFRWRGPADMKLYVRLSKYDPKSAAGSIEKETNDFYEVHKQGGSIDVRLLEVGGVRGVHYLVDDEFSKERTILWAGQYVHKGERMVVFVHLSSLSNRFTTNRNPLYAILNSIKFVKD